MLDVSRSSQLLCLGIYLPQEHQALAPHISQQWATLSGFAHHHPYEMVVLPIEIASVLGDLETTLATVLGRCHVHALQAMPAE